MFKKIILIGLFVGLVALLVVGAVNRTLAKTEPESSSETHLERGLADADHLLPAPAVHDAADNPTESEIGAVTNAGGPGAAEENGLGPALHEFNPTAAYEITPDEVAALLYMREEEKLAHDVYQAMYALWGKPIFQNISASEQTHTEAVQALLAGYNIPDPASDQPGVFSDPGLQKLYDQLLSQGSQSQTEALRVGAAIEEIDILDLQVRLQQTSNPDVQQVFTSLLQGSANHLKAFSTILAVETGVDYRPQYMSPEAYQAAIAQAGAGAGAGQGRGAGNGRRAAP